MHSYVKLLVLCLLATFAAQASASHLDKIVVEEEVNWCKAKCSGDKDCRAKKVECLAAKAEEEAAKAEKEAEEADKNTDWCKKKCNGDKECKAKKAACKKAKEEAAKKEEEEKKEEGGGKKPKPTGQTDAYGIPVTKKSGMNRACRTCSSPACLSASSNRATNHRLVDSLTR